MKKIISIALIMVVCCISVCACSSAKEGNKPGTAIIDDCNIEIESAEVRGLALYVNVKFKNNSKEAKSISDLAEIKAFANGLDISIGSSDVNTKILPNKEIDMVFMSVDSKIDKERNEITLQIVKDDTVITETTYNLETIPIIMPKK